MKSSMNEDWVDRASKVFLSGKYVGLSILLIYSYDKEYIGKLLRTGCNLRDLENIKSVLTIDQIDICMYAYMRS